jgi:hypothetical integral membrane protein (TIGR02206 family)
MAPPAAAFHAYGPSHAAVGVLFVVGVVAVVVLGRDVRGRATEQQVRRGFALLIPVFTVPLQVLQLLPDDYDVGTSLPLQLCDLSWMVAIHALWTRSRRSSAVLYFWGLTLTVQALITPTLDQAFPDPRFFMFFGMHLLTIWAAVFLTFGLGCVPDWRGYRFTVMCTAGWAAAVMGVNAVAGTNYGYLAHKPSTGSVLDVLGPWPLYVVVEVAAVVAGWALITWPWVRRAPGPRGSSRGGYGMRRRVRRRSSTGY